MPSLPIIYIDIQSQHAGSDECEDDGPDTTLPPEDKQGQTRGRKTDQRGDEAPPRWITRTMPLTLDATTIAVHEALVRVANIVETKGALA